MPSSTNYPPYGQSINRVAVPGESEQERAAYRHEAQEYTQPSSYPGMAMHPLQPNDHAREASSQSYASYPDSAYATVGNQSRLNSENNTPQVSNTRIQPPTYASPLQNGAPPVDPSYPRAQVANGQPASYPTYTEQQQQHHHHPAKPAPPADVVGKGWAGFSLQDIRDLSPKAKKRLIWCVIHFPGCKQSIETDVYQMHAIQGCYISRTDSHHPNPL